MTKNRYSQQRHGTIGCTGSPPRAVIEYDLILGLLWDGQIDAREAAILYGIGGGQSLRAIARHLRICDATVRNRLARVRSVIRSVITS